MVEGESGRPRDDEGGGRGDSDGIAQSMQPESVQDDDHQNYPRLLAQGGEGPLEKVING